MEGNSRELWRGTSGWRPEWSKGMKQENTQGWSVSSRSRGSKYAQHVPETLRHSQWGWKGGQKEDREGPACPMIPAGKDTGRHVQLTGCHAAVCPGAESAGHTDWPKRCRTGHACNILCIKTKTNTRQARVPYVCVRVYMYINTVFKSWKDTLQSGYTLGTALQWDKQSREISVNLFTYF